MTAVESDLTDPKPMGINEFMALLSTAAEMDGNPKPLLQGAFAMYATPGGGLMIALNIPDGPMIGQHHQAIPPGFVRGGLLFAQGDKVAALKAIGGAMLKKTKGDK